MNSSAQSKVYIEIVKQLKKMIDQEELEPGDKIPSERDLSERLNVGRSSVREALRSLELLGLIETRRGEGTFLKDGRDNQLVQFLGTFILHNDKAKKDIKETKYFLEMDFLRLIIRKCNKDELLSLRKWTETANFNDNEFFLKIATLADNYLLYRIWVILNDFYETCYMNHLNESRNVYLDLTEALLQLDEKKAIEVYEQLRSINKQ